MHSTNVEQTRISVLLTRRGTSCIFSPIHKDKDRCAPLSLLREPVSALPPALARSDTANLFAGAAGGVRFRGPRRAIVAARWHAPPRLRPRPRPLSPACPQSSSVALPPPPAPP